VPPKLIGLIAHVGKPNAAVLIEALQAKFRGTGVRVKLESKTARLVGAKSAETPRSLGRKCDLLVVLGGDGTLLQAVHDLGEDLKPIFGINLGSLGFLTCVGAADYAKAVESILAASYILSRRTLLAVDVERGGKSIAHRTGLNDAVISRGELSRLIRLDIRIDDATLAQYTADGMIVSTPTGSTAYSLSAGGPILTPDSGVFLITPICPHVLTNRSVIVSDRSRIDVRPCEGQAGVFLTVDGQELVRIRSGDTICIRKAEREVALAMLPEISFFEVLREKLKWSGSAV
jgi:NAD+ kinase